MSKTAQDAVAEQLLRDLAPQVLGVVIRTFRDFADTEDALQEALLAAATQWPQQGIPDHPRAWLIQVATRRLTDNLRRETARRRRETVVAMDGETSVPLKGLDDSAEHDDTLVLVFMCCHPALSDASAIALTLRAVGGLTTREIAAAFFVPEATMAQRISRAKQSIQASRARFEWPAQQERAERLSKVLHVLYLIFNEGYVASSGASATRIELSSEAIRLTREVSRLRPDDAEVAGLLALMLFTDARRAARTGPGGELIPLAQQDRTLWDRQQITEGVGLIEAALPRGMVGAYQLQACIAAVHAEAVRADETDWQQILALYELLKRITGNPMVTLNHAVAMAMVRGPAAGLDLLTALDADARLRGNHRLDAARAHLLEMADDDAAAQACFERAAGLTASLPERNYLRAQAARLREKSAMQQPTDA